MIERAFKSFKDVPMFGAVREHSRNPDEAFTEAERLMPAARRIELFSRQSRRGWDTAGHEVGKFDHLETAA